MTRPAVSVVIPFAGSSAEADAAMLTLLALRTGPCDELLLVDNSGPGDAVTAADRQVIVVRAGGERSPAHARNVGAERAGNDWVLFLDADCRAPADLLDAYFRAGDVPDDVGALAGEVTASSDGTTVAARYGAARGFLRQGAHLSHPYLPRAVAANLLVRRRAFAQIGGFYEGVRAAEDTDFSWRLQQTGWRLELRPDAEVKHVYRTTVGELRRQWRGYAAGRAWLARRYEGFRPEPALRRLVLRRGRRSFAGARGAGATPVAVPAMRSRVERLCHLGLDALLGFEELAGLLMSNRPSHPARSGGHVQVVLVADRFPAGEDSLVALAQAPDGARVDALARPQRVATDVARELRIDYREDDGAAARVGALLELLVRHPIRGLRAFTRHRRGLLALAPAAVRLERDRDARLHALGGAVARQTASELSLLTGRPFGDGVDA